MKSILIPLISLISLSLNTIAQEFKVNWSDETKAKNGMHPNKILGEWNNEVYILKDSYSSAGVHHYLSLEVYSSKDMQLTNSNEFEIPNVKGRGVDNIVDIFLVKGNIILFYDHLKVKFAKPYSKDQTAEYKFFAAHLDKNGKVIGEPLLIFEELLERDVRKATFYSKNSRVVLSTDSTKFFAFSGNIRKGKLNGKTIDHELKVLSSKAIQLPATKISYWSNFILDGKDNIYCTSKEKSDEPKKFNYKLHCFNIKTNSVKSKNIEVKSSYPLSLLHLNKYKEKLQFVAYYYNSTKQKTLGGGIIFHEFNANSLDVITSNENEFDSGIVEKLNSSGEFTKSNLSYDSVNTINSLINTKIVNLPNDQVYVISEQLALLESNASIGHDYLNILVSKINKSGLQNIYSVIPKLQSGGTKSYYSFLDIVRNNKLYLIINDNARNLDLKDPYKLENRLLHVTGSCSAIISIDENGGWEKRLFYKVNEESSYLFPSMYYFKNSNSIFIYGRKENMIRFANIKIEG